MSGQEGRVPPYLHQPKHRDRLTAGDRALIARARQIADVAGLDSARDLAGLEEGADLARVYARCFGMAQHVLSELARLVDQ